MVSESQEFLWICSICGKPTPLETCEIDEKGLPVHETCYTLKLSLADGTRGKKDDSTGTSG
jgi:hypothetical protein